MRTSNLCSKHSNNRTMQNLKIPTLTSACSAQNKNAIPSSSLAVTSSRVKLADRSSKSVWSAANRYHHVKRSTSVSSARIAKLRCSLSHADTWSRVIIALRSWRNACNVVRQSIKWCRFPFAVARLARSRKCIRTMRRKRRSRRRMWFRERIRMVTTSTWTTTAIRATNSPSWQHPLPPRRLSQHITIWAVRLVRCSATISYPTRTSTMVPATQPMQRAPLLSQILSSTLTFSMTCKSCNSNCRTSKSRQCVRSALIVSKIWSSSADTVCVNIAAIRLKDVRFVGRRSRRGFCCFERSEMRPPNTLYLQQLCLEILSILLIVCSVMLMPFASNLDEKSHIFWI